MSSNASEKRIMIESDSMNDTTKSVIKTIFSPGVLEEVSLKDMHIIVSQIKGNNDTNIEPSDSAPILIYPPTGKGGISIKTNDYACLAVDVYLNDIIIDFYLKYLFNDVLTAEQKAKTHIFSTYFYNTLTNTNLLGSPGKDVKLTAPQKRHDRVKKWTKNVNIFEKDFIIVPINQQSHWFLAIICFLPLKGPVTMETNQPVKMVSTAKKKTPVERKQSVALQIGNTTITPVSKKEYDSMIYVDEESERDEAEGDESDLESDGSEPEPPEAQPTNQPIKQ